MPYRLTPFITDRHYHIYARGNNRQEIVADVTEFVRLLFCILFFQGQNSPKNISRYIKQYFKTGVFDPDRELQQVIEGNRVVEIVSFSILPNHFHLILRQLQDNGVPDYMSRLLKSHAKFRNLRQDGVGHVFQGNFGARYITDENYLTYLTAYIHRNIVESRSWQGKAEKYPWSSFYDYVYGNRWESLLNPEIVLERFPSQSEYLKFVHSSGAKLNEMEGWDI